MSHATWAGIDSRCEPHSPALLVDSHVQPLRSLSTPIVRGMSGIISPSSAGAKTLSTLIIAVQSALRSTIPDSTGCEHARCNKQMDQRDQSFSRCRSVWAGHYRTPVKQVIECAGQIERSQWGRL